MDENREVIIYWKSIQFEVVLPEDKVWPFALAFGEEFSCEDSHAGRVLATLDEYFAHPNGYHVKVHVWAREEIKFYTFLENFCKQHGLPVRKKDLQRWTH